MPLVTVTWYPGRSQAAKELVARGVADALAEATGCRHDTVQVIFEEIAIDSWAVGLGIAAAGGPTPAGAAAPPVHVVCERVVCRRGCAEQLLTWLRERRHPALAVAAGLLGVSVCRLGDDDLLLTIRWRSEADAVAHRDDERTAALEAEADALVERRWVEHAGARLGPLAQPQSPSSG